MARNAYRFDGQSWGTLPDGALTAWLVLRGGGFLLFLAAAYGIGRLADVIVRAAL